MTSAELMVKWKDKLAAIVNHGEAELIREFLYDLEDLDEPECWADMTPDGYDDWDAG